MIDECVECKRVDDYLWGQLAGGVVEVDPEMNMLWRQRRTVVEGKSMRVDKESL